MRYLKFLSLLLFVLFATSACLVTTKQAVERQTSLEQKLVTLENQVDEKLNENDARMTQQLTETGSQLSDLQGDLDELEQDIETFNHTLADKQIQDEEKTQLLDSKIDTLRVDQDKQLAVATEKLTTTSEHIVELEMQLLSLENDLLNTLEQQQIMAGSQNDISLQIKTLTEDLSGVQANLKADMAQLGADKVSQEKLDAFKAQYLKDQIALDARIQQKIAMLSQAYEASHSEVLASLLALEKSSASKIELIKLRGQIDEELAIKLSQVEFLERMNSFSENFASYSATNAKVLKELNQRSHFLLKNKADIDHVAQLGNLLKSSLADMNQSLTIKTEKLQDSLSELEKIAIQLNYLKTQSQFLENKINTVSNSKVDIETFNNKTHNKDQTITQLKQQMVSRSEFIDKHNHILDLLTRLSEQTFNKEVEKVLLELTTTQSDETALKVDADQLEEWQQSLKAPKPAP